METSMGPMYGLPGLGIGTVWYHGMFYILKKLKKTKILLVQTLIMLRDGTQCATCVQHRIYLFLTNL
jgi:hypothetical protein